MSRIFFAPVFNLKVGVQLIHGVDIIFVQVSGPLDPYFLYILIFKAACMFEYVYKNKGGGMVTWPNMLWIQDKM